MEDFGDFDYDYQPEWLERSDDYNVWEEARVFEDLAAERAEAEAEAAAEVAEAEQARMALIVTEALAPFMLGTEVEANIVDAIVDALTAPQAAEDDEPEWCDGLGAGGACGRFEPHRAHEVEQ